VNRKIIYTTVSAYV